MDEMTFLQAINGEVILKRNGIKLDIALSLSQRKMFETASGNQYLIWQESDKLNAAYYQ